MHHYVYVIPLHPTAHSCIDVVRLVNRIHGVPSSILYVGCTGIPVSQRFQQHKAGIKSNKLVQRYGTNVTQSLGPFSFETASALEAALARELTKLGHLVIQS